jgi:hypothetical protein
MSQRLRTNQIAVSGVAVALSATPVECKSFLLKNPKTNTNTIYFGDSTVTLTTGYPLVPGEEFEFEFIAKMGEPVYDIQPQDVYIVGTAPDRAAWVSAGK